MYFLPDGIKDDPIRRWALPDRIFFGFGACHILAGTHRRVYPASGFQPLWIRPAPGHTGTHIVLRRGETAFDFHGYCSAQRLLTRYWAGWQARHPGWSASIEPVDFDLLDTAALNARGMRGPDQYLGDPVARARRFLARYAPSRVEGSMAAGATGRQPLSGAVHFRPLVADDQSALWHWLHLALWDPPPAPLRPLEVLQQPGVRLYAEAWGRPTDVGRVAVVAGQDVGACWVRLVPDRQGLAHVDDQTPQLGIALEPAFQHRGLGRPLMLATLQACWQHGYRQVSLTVHPQNPARRMYAACGFREAGLRGTYHLMVAGR